MPIVRRKLDPADVYPTDLRYNAGTDTVQSLINGVWTDNPAADPRKQTTLPPRLTSDPACDAAKSVSDAFKNQIDKILVAITESQTFFTIAGIILALFSFGFFGIFIGIAITLAHFMLDSGTAAISAALTPTVWDTFTCILFCHMNSQGRVKTGEFGAILSDVSGQIGGLGADILNAMLSLAGEGGVNNLASLGSSSGDCSACGCGCPEIDVSAVFGTYITRGVNSDGHCFVRMQAANHGSADQIDIAFALGGAPVSGSCAKYLGVVVHSGSPTTLNVYGVPCVFSSPTYPALSVGTCTADIVIEDPSHSSPGFQLDIIFEAC